jgi:hypothetical protein
VACFVIQYGRRTVDRNTYSCINNANHEFLFLSITALLHVAGIGIGDRIVILAFSMGFEYVVQAAIEILAEFCIALIIECTSH